MPTLPAPALAPVILDAPEEAFLRHYTEVRHRGKALVYAGLARDEKPPLATLQEATRIIAKAEQLPLATLATAVGADKLYFLSLLKRVCESEEGHISIKGLNILARIHGIFTDDKRTHTNIALILGQPETRATPTQVHGLPFQVYEVTPEPPAPGTTP